MQIRHLLTAAILSLSAGLLPLGIARADTVMYDSAGLIQGQQSFTDSFVVPTAGTLTVTLTDIPWLDTVSDLSGFVSTTTGVIGKPMTLGTESIYVQQPGTVYAHFFGDANGTYGIGAYGVKVSFNAGPSPVPLPGTLVLLFSGLGLLLGWQRRPRTRDDASREPASPSHDNPLTI